MSLPFFETSCLERRGPPKALVKHGVVQAMFHFINVSGDSDNAIAILVGVQEHDETARFRRGLLA